MPATQEALAELGRQGDAAVGVQLLAMGVRVGHIVPECVGLSLALLAENLTLTLVASGSEVAALDAVQYVDGGRVWRPPSRGRRCTFTATTSSMRNAGGCMPRP